MKRVTPNNIEKCPSVLYFGKAEYVKQNFNYLQEQKIGLSNIKTCLSVLPTEPVELRNTYKYVLDNYGRKYLNKQTSILKVPVERIEDIENNFPQLNKEITLQAVHSGFDLSEIEKVLEVCGENSIEIRGSVFNRTAEEIEKIVKVCRENEIKITGSVFSRTAEEIKERQAFIEQIGESVVVEKKSGRKFNPIFGWSRKKYQEMKKDYEQGKKTKRKVKAQDIGKASYTADVDSCDNAQKVLENIQEQTQEKGDDINNNDMEV